MFRTEEMKKQIEEFELVYKPLTVNSVVKDTQPIIIQQFTQAMQAVRKEAMRKRFKCSGCGKGCECVSI